MSSLTSAADEPVCRSRYSGLAIVPIIAITVLFLAVFGNGIDIARNVDRSQGVSISFQVVFRIAVGTCALAVGAWGWWRLPAVRQLLQTSRGWLVMVFIAGAFLSITQSPEKPVSLFVASMVLGYTLLTLTCLALFSFKTVAITVMLAVWAYVLLGWGAYLFYPEIGVFKEFLSLTQSVDRMGGVGHPNTTGRSVCLATVMLLVACKQHWIHWRWAVAAVPLLILTLIETKSRSPVIATVLAIGIVCLPLLKIRSIYLLIAAVFLAGAASLLYVESTSGLDLFLEKTLLKTSKSGSLREITSLTGRTEIWQESLKFIRSSPLLGHGGGSSAKIMFEHSGHAHNMLLETALLYGIPITLVVATLLMLNIKDSFCSRIPMIPEFTVFVVVLGLVESPMVGMPADPILALWLASIFAKPLQELEQRSAASVAKQRLPSSDVAYPAMV